MNSVKGDEQISLRRRHPKKDEVAGFEIPANGHLNFRFFAALFREVDENENPEQDFDLSAPLGQLGQLADDDFSVDRTSCRCRLVVVGRRRRRCRDGDGEEPGAVLVHLEGELVVLKHPLSKKLICYRLCSDSAIRLKLTNRR